jgi:hypothetical protein
MSGAWAPIPKNVMVEGFFNTPSDYVLYGPWVGRDIPIQKIKTLPNGNIAYGAYDGSSYTKIVITKADGQTPVANPYYIGQPSEMDTKLTNATPSAPLGSYLLKRIASSGVNPQISINMSSNMKQMIQDKQKTVANLVDVAKKVLPVAQKTEQMDATYDAAFETDQPGQVPGIAGTLQGFALVFFVAAYAAFALTFSAYQFNKSGNFMSLAMYLGVFLIAGVFGLILTSRLG